MPVDVVPPTRSRLAGAEYADAFRITANGRHPAEQWARSAFEGGPSAKRRLFGLVVWRGLLGLRLAPFNSSDHVAGWAIVENEPETVVLHAESWLIVARLVIDVADSHTTLTTLMRYVRPEGRAVWAVLGIAHRRLAPRVLAGARRSLLPA